MIHKEKPLSLDNASRLRPGSHRDTASTAETGDASLPPCHVRALVMGLEPLRSVTERCHELR